MPLAGHGRRPTPLRRRASRPQLKRDPLGRMQGPPEQGRLVREAFRLGNELLMDLTAGTQVYLNFRDRFVKTPAPELIQTSVTRLCLFHIIISLSKCSEFYDRYKAIIPENVKATAKRLDREIEERGVVKFRNTVVGHIWDDERKRPLTKTEIQERLNWVTKSNIPGLFAWVNDGQPEHNPATVVGMIELVLDGIRDAFGLSPADFPE